EPYGHLRDRQSVFVSATAARFATGREPPLRASGQRLGRSTTSPSRSHGPQRLRRIPWRRGSVRPRPLPAIHLTVPGPAHRPWPRLLPVTAGRDRAPHHVPSIPPEPTAARHAYA